MVSGHRFGAEVMAEKRVRLPAGDVALHCGCRRRADRVIRAYGGLVFGVRDVCACVYRRLPRSTITHGESPRAQRGRSPRRGDRTVFESVRRSSRLVRFPFASRRRRKPTTRRRTRNGPRGARATRDRRSHLARLATKRFRYRRYGYYLTKTGRFRDVSRRPVAERRSVNVAPR